MTDEPLTESDAITGTKTALVLDLADGRTVELTAHVATARDDGLRAIDEFEPDGKPDTQRCFKAATATLVLRDVDAEDDDPIGLLPTSDLDVDPDRAPDGWELLGREAVDGKIGDSEYWNPVWEHESGEAWLKVTRSYRDGVDSYVFELEAGTPSLGLFGEDVATAPVDGTGASGVAEIARKYMAQYDHDVPDDGGDA